MGVLPGRIREIGSVGFVAPEDDHDIMIQGWCKAVNRAVDQHILSDDEVRNLNQYRQRFGVRRRYGQSKDFGRQVSQSLLTFRQALFLKLVAEKRTVPKIDKKDIDHWKVRIPFNLLKSETLLWMFTNVKYFQEVTRREFVGSSSGVSIRVAKGVYLRQSAFRGHPVERSSMTHQDTGLMGITTKHIYFTGDRKSFRVRLDRIVSFTPYSDGVGIMRDLVRAKPEAFVNRAGWFTLNMLDLLGDGEEFQVSEDAPTVEDFLNHHESALAYFSATTSMN